jgi:hypothetical protein
MNQLKNYILALLAITVTAPLAARVSIITHTKITYSANNNAVFTHTTEQTGTFNAPPKTTNHSANRFYIHRKDPNASPEATFFYGKRLSLNRRTQRSILLENTSFSTMFATERSHTFLMKSNIPGMQQIANELQTSPKNAHIEFEIISAKPEDRTWVYIEKTIESFTEPQGTATYPVTRVVVFGPTEHISKPIFNLLKALVIQDSSTPANKNLLIGSELSAAGLAMAYVQTLQNTRVVPPATDSQDFFIEYFANYNSPTAEKISLAKPSLKSIIGSLQSDGTMAGGYSYGPTGEAETAHNWIQLAFPTEQVSQFAHKDVTSNAIVRAAFASRPELRAAIECSFRFYLNFMGLMLITAEDDSLTIKPLPDSAAHKEGLTNFLHKTHNFQRATRILQSLNEHGQPGLAQIFYDYLLSISDAAVTKAGTPIGTWEESKTFFCTAMKGKETASGMQYPKATANNWKKSRA